MQEFLAHPAVQAGVAPFVVALAAALLLRPLKLAGLAIACGFATAVFLIAGFEFTPLTTTRKIMLVGLAAAPFGLLLDLVARRTATAAVTAAVVAAAITPWVFFTVLRQKDPALMATLGAGTALACACLAGFMVSLRADALRAGAASMAIGTGVGVAAVLGASASFGQYGIAVGVAGGAFLFSLCVLGPKISAGSSLALAAAMTGGLLAGGTLVLASLPWLSLALLALVPLAVRLPLPEKANVWIKATLAGVYACVPAVAACFIAWRATSTTS